MKLRTRIVLLAIIPLYFLGTFMYLLSSNKLEEGVVNQTYDGMQASSVLVMELINANSDGSYQLKDNKLYKGDSYNLSEQNEVIDLVKEESGYDISIFYGDTRYATTIIDEKGERQIGTKASAEVAEEVLGKGNPYQSKKIDVLGKRYIGYYLPLYQPDSKEIAGMIFLGEEYDKMHQIVHNTKAAMGVIEAIITTLTILVVYLIARKIVKTILKGISYVSLMSKGHLDFTIDQKLLNRKDALGEMCRGIMELEQQLLTIIKDVKEQCNILEQTSIQSIEASSDALESVEQIDQKVRDIAENSGSQAKSAYNAEESVTAMGNMIEDTKQRMEVLATSTDSTAAASNKAKNILAELNENMKKVMQAMQEVEERTNQTHISVEKATGMTNIITEIASQTSLLA